MESISGKESFQLASGTSASAGAHFPSQFEFGAGDQHNWQGRNDERIKLAVMTVLHWDLAVPRDRVRVGVSHGWVTLTGRVLRDYQSLRAEADARTVPGVGGVTNRLTCEVENEG